MKIHSISLRGRACFAWIVFVTIATIFVYGAPADSSEKTLTVGVYGGYFQDSFDENIFPDFTKETGIKIVSIAEPAGFAWLVQLERAVSAGKAPADVNMIDLGGMLRGEKQNLWVPLDLKKIPNHQYLMPQFVHRYPDGRVDGIGAVSWYTTLVSNTDVIKEVPTSWAELWSPKRKDNLGLIAGANNSYLLEIAANTYFGGDKILDTKEGILKVLAKVAELKPNVKLWYRDEGVFQQALQSGEIPMGMYYHDVTGLAAAEGFPVISTFPKEGGVLDSGCWAVLKTSKKIEEAHIFMNYMSRPEIQAKLARKVGTAPTVRRDTLDLTDEEFNAVSSEIPPIIIRYDIYHVSYGDWINEKWMEMVTE